jgi:hypothetical protein
VSVILEEFAALFLVSGMYALAPDPEYVRACFRAVALAFFIFVGVGVAYSAGGVLGIRRVPNRLLRVAFGTLFFAGFFFCLALPSMLEDWLMPAPPDVIGKVFIHTNSGIYLLVTLCFAALSAVALRRPRHSAIAA